MVEQHSSEGFTVDQNDSVVDCLDVLSCTLRKGARRYKDALPRLPCCAPTNCWMCCLLTG